MSRWEQRRSLMLSTLIGIIVVASLSFGLSALPIQSSDRDHPTPLKSTEIVGLIGANEHQQDKYYTFFAGPGEVHVTLNVQTLPGKSFPVSGATVVLFGPDSKQVGKLFVQSGGSDEQQETRFALSRRVPMLLRISPYDNGGSGGRYKIRFDGPIDTTTPPNGEVSPSQTTAAIMDATAASKDRDHPTPLTSLEIKGLIGSKEQQGDEDRYYKFFAGPGDLSVTLDVETLQGKSFPVSGATVEIFGPDSQRVDSLFVQSDGSDEQQVKRFTLKRRVPLLLRISPYDNGGSGGKYRVRISGSAYTSQ